MMICNCDETTSAQPIGWGFNASRYSTDELTDKTHDFELNKHSDERIFVNIDSRTMGVGGYDRFKLFYVFMFRESLFYYV